MIKRIVLSALLVVFASKVSANDTILLDQNWNADERRWFHHVSQGSRLLPYDLFLGLDAVDESIPFKSDANLIRFGFIPAPVSQYNPDGLPIGFARDRGWIGLTCAACHTSELNYRGRTIRIEGGQSHIDLQSLLAALERAMVLTLEEPARFERLANRLGQSVNSTVLRERLQHSYDVRRRENAQNRSRVAYGYARLDAFGAIYNKGLTLTGVEENGNPSEAPANYPYLWDTPQHDWVEWNGSSPNPAEGAFFRNVGEVVGVYGQVDVEPHSWFGLVDRGYRSSVRLRTLRRIEKHVAKLTSPVWPEDVLPTIDRELAARGEPLYATYCGSCHLSIVRDDPNREVQVRLSSLAEAGTDPVLARQAVELKGATGIFEGKPRFYLGGETLKAEAPALYIVNHVMGGILKNGIVDVLLAQRDAKLMGHTGARHPPKYIDGVPVAEGTETESHTFLAYKARPLNGVWATAPYLHNGSVLSLYELMLPQAERSSAFALGGWLFDPERVGYISTPRDDAFVFDTSVEGNSNAGHEYGTGADGLPKLDAAQIDAILEYMKTL